MIGPPISAPTGITSLNKRNPNKDAIIGSPKGTDETAVAVTYLMA
jgi:hypothetical protein